jgi:cytochrome c peroxidase
MTRSSVCFRAALLALLALTSLPVAPAIPTSAIEALGRSLFESTALSADNTTSCATCHQPARAFTDGRRVAVGVANQQATRNTPSLLDVGTQTSLFWDGRRANLEEQATDPLLNPREHGLADESDLLERLRRSSEWVDSFRQAFGVSPEPISISHVSEALAAFQRTLISARTPFDRYLAGDKKAISEAARRGWLVFDQQAQCTRCHKAEGAKPLFTDNQFHALGVGLSKVARDLPLLTQRLVAIQQKAGDRGAALNHEVLADPSMAELGRFAVSLDPSDIGKFKTPGLRNVALTAPYMHDGSVATLIEAVELEVYYRGNRQGRPLILTPGDREDMLAFLRGLTGEGMP